MTDFEKLVKKLANTLLSVQIGRTMDVYHPELERVDMSKQDFQELRKLAQEVLAGVRE